MQNRDGIICLRTTQFGAFVRLDKRKTPIVFQSQKVKVVALLTGSMETVKVG
jgi:hypothetical protein